MNTSFPSVSCVRRAGIVICTGAWMLLGTPVVNAAWAAAETDVSTFTTRNGLPTNDLRCALSSPYGFVWFCSKRGLIRFEGGTFVTFGHRAGLDPPAVYALVRPSVQGLPYFVGTDHGLVEFLAHELPEDSRRFVTIKRRDGKPSGRITAFAVNTGSVWCATSNGLLRLTFESVGFGKPARRILEEVDIGLPASPDGSRTIRSLFVDTEGTLWIGTTYGLYRRRANGHTTRVEDDALAGDIWALTATVDGRLFAGTSQGLVRIERQGVDQDGVRAARVFDERDGLPSARVTSLDVIEQTMWIGTARGVVQVALPHDSLAIIGTIPGEETQDVIRDGDGAIWVVGGDGARRLPRADTGELPDTARAGVSSVFALLNDGVCAIATDSSSLRCTQRGQTSLFAPMVTTIPSSILGDATRGWSVLTNRDRQGRWFVPIGRTLLQFPAREPQDLATTMPEARYTGAPQTPFGQIVSTFIDDQGSVWVATDDARARLARIDPFTHDVTVFDDEHGLKREFGTPRAFADGPDRRVWIAFTSNRLIRYDGQRFDAVSLQETNTHGEGAPDVSALSGGLGRIWIASRTHGLGSLRETASTSGRQVEITWYDTSPRLFQGDSPTLLQTTPWRLLVGSERGLFEFDTTTRIFTPYRPPNGSPVANLRQAIYAHQHVWLVGTHGTLTTAPVRTAPALPPRIMVTAMRVDGTPLPSRADGSMDVRGLTVAAHARRLEIDWILPWLTNNAGETLEYEESSTLVGPRQFGPNGDMNWGPSSRTESIGYTRGTQVIDLAQRRSGNYLLRMRLGFPRQVKSETLVQYAVLPSVWIRWWFVPPIIGSIFLVVYTIKLKHSSALSEVRARIAADLHDRVGARLSRIAILSEVVRQQVEHADADAASALTSIGDNARDVIDDMGDAIWFIDPKIDNVYQLVVRLRTFAASIFDGQATWSVDADNATLAIALDADQRRNLYLIVKEALANVFRHAHASRVEVRFRRPAQGLVVEVVDNGVGIEAVPDAVGTGGRGLPNMRMRVAELGGTLAVSSAMSATGTRVVIHVPNALGHKLKGNAGSLRRSWLHRALKARTTLLEQVQKIT